MVSSAGASGAAPSHRQGGRGFAVAGLYKPSPKQSALFGSSVALASEVSKYTAAVCIGWSYQGPALGFWYSLYVSCDRMDPLSLSGKNGLPLGKVWFWGGKSGLVF